MTAPSDPLAPFPDRRAGSVGERQATAALQKRLKDRGFEVRRHGFVTPTTPAGVVFAHLLLALAPAVASWWWPVASTAALALVVASLWAEHTGRSVLRGHLPRGRSYNLVVPLSPPAARRLVLVAYIDQPQTGVMFSRRLVAMGGLTAGLLALTSLLRLLDVPFFDYVHISLCGLLALLTAAGFLLSRTVKGRGPSPAVGRLLRLAEESPQLPDTQVVLAFCGAGHPWGAGLATLKRHYAHLWGDATRIVPMGDRSLDEVLS